MINICVNKNHAQVPFQYYLFARKNAYNEALTKIQDEGTKLNSQVLSEVKTVRQFAQELHETAAHTQR